MRFCLLTVLASSLFLGLLPMSKVHVGSNSVQTALGATFEGDEPGEGNIFGIVNQSGTNPDLLLTWAADNPQAILTNRPVTGLSPGEKIIGIDFDSATSKVIGITNIGNVILIDPKTGQALKVTGIPSSFIEGKASLDFDPVAKVLRIASEKGLSVEIDLSRVPPTVTLDSLPTYAPDDANAGKTPKIGGMANNKKSGVTEGDIFIIDSAQDVLAMLQGFRLKTIGNLGVNASSSIGFSAVPGSNFGFAALQLEGEEGSRFYVINLINGQATEIGSIAFERPVSGMAMLQDDSEGIECMVSHVGSSENPVFTDHTITVTVKKDGKLIDAIVFIHVQEGPNKGISIAAPTEDDPDTEEKDPKLSFTYTSNGVPGEDLIKVEVLTADGKTSKCETVKKWFVPQITINQVVRDKKRLIVTGCCFQPGDKVFVNSEEQKTKNDSANPTTVLIAKKGGKKLQECTGGFTNRVFVRRAQPGQPVLDTNAFATCP
jgi:hypothetical protein